MAHAVVQLPVPAGSFHPRRAALERALVRIEHRPVELLSMAPLCKDRGGNELKQAGYGVPLLLRYRVEGDREERRVVFRTMGPNWFGHDRRSDRAALALLAADTYHLVPDHVRVLDVGALDHYGDLLSLRGAGEFYLVTSYAEGRLYAEDLRRIEEAGAATEEDLARARALAGWLADLHGEPFHGPPELYQRAIRDLLGGGEGIFGICDSYPEDGVVPFERLAAIEQQCLAWRWKLRSRSGRLRRTHGDFHPYNILFRRGEDFTVLDASRGGVGDPADDLAAMTINYVFGAAMDPRVWKSGLRPLWEAFWSVYLSTSGDHEVLEVIAPFFAWRALVVACPVWYPSLSSECRDRLLSFAERALDCDGFDLECVDRWVS